MHIIPKSTRHTKAGTFRRGVPYEVDEKAALIKKHVVPHTHGENPVFEKVSATKAKQAAATASAPVSDAEEKAKTPDGPPSK